MKWNWLRGFFWTFSFKSIDTIIYDTAFAFESLTELNQKITAYIKREKLIVLNIKNPIRFNLCESL